MHMRYLVSIVVFVELKGPTGEYQRAFSIHKAS